MCILLFDMSYFAGISVTTDIPKTNNGAGHRSESGQLTQHFYINVLSIQFIVVLNYLN